MGEAAGHLPTPGDNLLTSGGTKGDRLANKHISRVRCFPFLPKTRRTTIKNYQEMMLLVLITAEVGRKEEDELEGREEGGREERRNRGNIYGEGER